MHPPCRFDSGACPNEASPAWRHLSTLKRNQSARCVHLSSAPSHYPHGQSVEPAVSVGSDSDLDSDLDSDSDSDSDLDSGSDSVLILFLHILARGCLSYTSYPLIWQMLMTRSALPRFLPYPPDYSRRPRIPHNISSPPPRSMLSIQHHHYSYQYLRY